MSHTCFKNEKAPTFRLEEFELLPCSQEVLSQNDEDDAQRDGSDEDVRTDNGHSEDGAGYDQRQLDRNKVRVIQMTQVNVGTVPPTAFSPE